MVSVGLNIVEEQVLVRVLVEHENPFLGMLGYSDSDLRVLV